MTVLDLGSGAGDVAFLAREFVGSDGRVLGIDSNSTSLLEARRRADERGYSNVSFLDADVTAGVPVSEEIDAIVGRRFLIYFSDPLEVLKPLIPHLKPGGVLAFQEPVIDEDFGLNPRSELMDRLTDWGKKLMTAGGYQIALGPNLDGIFRDLGLEVLQPAEAFRHPEGLEGLENQLDFGRSLLPALRSLEIAPAEELDQYDEYAEAIRTEVREHGREFVPLLNYNAWARKPTAGHVTL